MTLDETINEAKITAVLYEKEARECIQHDGSFYEEKAKALRKCAKELEQVVEWLEELKTYREIHGKADRPQGEWTNTGVLTVHCSNCNSEFHELEAMNFCPNCGAKMEGGDSE